MVILTPRRQWNKLVPGSPSWGTSHPHPSRGIDPTATLRRFKRQESTTYGNMGWDEEHTSGVENFEDEEHTRGVEKLEFNPVKTDCIQITAEPFVGLEFLL